MAYLEIFERVAGHVRRQGVNVRMKRGKPLTKPEILQISTQSLISIPTSMVEFYAEVGDGIEFRWRAEGDWGPFANLESPRLKDRVSESNRRLNNRIEWEAEHDFRFTKNPTLARQTAIKMRKWMQFHEEGNGDSFCLDTASDAPPVVFNQHDWFDGGTGENGHRVADSLLQFYTEWAQVCFQSPSSLWWPSVLKKNGGGIDWSSAEFLESFRLSGE